VKKLLIISLLLISTYSFGQAVLSGSRGWDGFLTPGADSLITRMETATGKTMTVEGKTMISDIFTMYKDSLSITSLQNYFDILYFLDIGVETAAKLNWVKNAHNITNVNGVVFDTVGATGNGSSSYLNTNYSAKNNAVNLSLDNSSMGLYSKTSTGGVGATYMAGVQDSVRFGSNFTNVYFRLFQSSSINYLTANLGQFTISRTASNIVKVYKDGAIIINTNTVSTALPYNSITICAEYPSVFSNQTISHFFALKGIDDTEVRKIYNINKYWRENKNSITFFNP
jgi:hypothetical protein